MAVAFHPDAEYVALESGGEVYIVAEQLAAEFAGKSRGLKRRRISRASPAEMEYAKFAIRFLDRTDPGRARRLRHHGPGHRRSPHRALARRGRLQHRRKYKLDLTSNVDAAGHHAQRPARIRRQESFRRQRAHRRAAENARRADAFGKARALVSALLALPQSRSSSAPPSSGSSPWKRRCRAGPCAAATLDEIKKVKWDPAWGEERISNMIATRPDWCISRQRIWGVPIAVFLCEGCGKPLNDPSHQPAKCRTVRARRRRRLVHAARPTPWSRPEPNAPQCGGTKFRKETDILDVWFESGSQPRRRAGPRTGSALARRPIPRRRRPAPRMVPLFPAVRRGHARPGALSHGRHQWLDARRAGPGHVEVARQ